MKKATVFTILYCILFVIIPTIYFIFNPIDTKNVVVYLIVVFILSLFAYLTYKVLSWKPKFDSYHVCLHSDIEGPKHFDFDRHKMYLMLTSNPEPYLTLYVWFMCRTFAKTKNLHLHIGDEDIYVWSQIPVTRHRLWWRNGHFRNDIILGTFTMFNDDKPYKPTNFKIPYINSEKELLDIVQQINPKIKTLIDIVDL